MKKFLGIVMTAVCMLFASCNSCSKKAEPIMPDNAAEMVKGVDVDYFTGLDTQWMATHYPNDEWRWLECCIDMKNFIDEADTCEVVAVANIFSVMEVIDSTTGAFKSTVILRAHTMDTTVMEIKEGLWVGDDPLNNYIPMRVDFPHAWVSMMEANCVKPHSRHCVLRKEVGPICGVEPIYIFGNKDAQVYVMSNTGDVTTHNPVFPVDSNDVFIADTITYEGTIYGPCNTRIGCSLGE